MKNIKLTIEYDGTHFSGWQRQDNGRTVQVEIERALGKLLKKEVKIHGSGRTDAGVHALGQVASFTEDCTIPIEKLPLALNGLLPGDVSIKRAEEVGTEFHARYSAKGKKYLYKIYNSPFRSAINRNYAYCVSYPLALEEIKKASRYFIGEHDFEGFMSARSSVRNTVRTVYSIEVDRIADMITIDIEGNGFLYNMVRIIAGTLVDVGRRRIHSDKLLEIISSRKREKAGHTAPAQGLYLAEVFYESRYFEKK